jgi:hypothetical protein
MNFYKNHCIYCRDKIKSDPNFRIHKNDNFTGPEFPLCDRCGNDESISCHDIWRYIKEIEDGIYCKNYKIPHCNICFEE